MKSDQEKPDLVLKNNQGRAMSFLWVTPMDKTACSDLRRIQEFSRDVLLLTFSIAGTAWVLFIPWSDRPAGIRPAAWWGILVLWIGIFSVWFIRRKSHLISSIFFSTSLFLSITLLILGTGLRSAPYGYAVLLFVTSSMLGQVSVLIVGCLSLLTVLGIGTHIMGVNGLSLDVMGPTIVILCATVTSFLAARNLGMALAWVSESIDNAWEHAELARDRSAELARALKALDESSYRVERLNRQLRVAVEAAREAEDMKARFAANISHELRTPLNLVVGFSELLFEHPEVYDLQMSSRCLRDLNIIYRNALQLQSLVNDVLDLSQIHAARMSISPEWVSPGDLVEETVETIRSLVESKGLSLHTLVPKDVPDVMMDRTRIRQVLINLLSNAVRFTDEGNITLRLERRQDEIVFAVKDTGVGIREDQLPHLFKEFHQLDSGLSKRCGGAGLGLAISKGFVELHGGHIWVESHLGCGSTFNFALPVDSEARIIGARVDSTRGRTPGGGSVVIAITRSERALRLLRRYLEGKQVVMAQDIEQAEKLVQELTPEWLVADRALLGEDPDKVAANLGGGGLPTLICDLPQTTTGPMDPRVKGYLVKPVANQEIQQSLRQFGSSIETILVVDDDRDFGQLIGSLLTLPPRVYRVLKAYTAEEAIALLHQSPPDLMLLDLNLPDMSGIEVLRQTQQTLRLADMPVIIVTGEVDIDGQQSRNITANLIATCRDGVNESTLIEWIQGLIGSADGHTGAGSMIRKREHDVMLQEDSVA